MSELIGPLILRTVYYLWRRFRPLRLSDDAKAVLARMQADSTDNGVFIDSTALGDSGRKLACLHGNIEISTTRRVIAELEDKGLVAIVREAKREFPSEYVNLTHFGWRLNPRRAGLIKSADDHEVFRLGK